MICNPKLLLNKFSYYVFKLNFINISTCDCSCTVTNLKIPIRLRNFKFLKMGFLDLLFVARYDAQTMLHTQFK